MTSSRERIIDAAIQVASDAGLSETNIRSVAVQAGYSPSLVMRLFHSRAGLVGEMFLRGQADVIKRAREAAGLPGDTLSRCMNVFAEVAAADVARIALRREVMANAWSLDSRARSTADREREQIIPVLAEALSGLDQQDSYAARLKLADSLWSTYIAVVARLLFPGVEIERLLEELRSRLQVVLAGYRSVNGGPESS
jgi:AcrR family transcriptional regulator